MEILALVLLLIVVPILLLFVGGLALLRSGLRTPPLDEAPDTLPAAQVVSGGHSPLRDGGRSQARAIGNAIKIGLGTTLVGLGFGVVYVIYEFFTTPMFG